LSAFVPLEDPRRKNAGYEIPAWPMGRIDIGMRQEKGLRKGAP
jgi:hypothetical protein